MTEYLDLEDLLAAAHAAFGRAPEVRDWGLLEAALARPRASVYGQAAYPDLHELQLCCTRWRETMRCWTATNVWPGSPPVASAAS